MGLPILQGRVVRLLGARTSLDLWGIHMTTYEPPPKLCKHDDSSWCTEECAEKNRQFDEWVKARIRNAVQNGRMKHWMPDEP